MRSSRNRLSRDGALEHRVATGGETVRETMLRTIAGRAGRLEEPGPHLTRLLRPSLHRILSPPSTHQPDVELTAMSLTLDGEPLSDQMGLRPQGRYYVFMTSRDFSSSEDSPGELHMKDVMEAAFARGIETVDFMTPIMPYKLTWCREVATVTTIPWR